MAFTESALQPEALAYARGLLKAPTPKDPTWPAIGACVLWAAASLGLAFAMLTAPAPGAPLDPPQAAARATINR